MQTESFIPGKDASLGGEFPVVNVTLLHPEDQGCLSSFGAHPRFEIALEHALTELLQGRGLDALAGFPPPGFDLDEIAADGTSTLASAEAMLRREERCFGIVPGLALNGSKLHQALLAAYAKLSH